MIQDCLHLDSEQAGYLNVIVVAVSAGIRDRLARTLRLPAGVELREGSDVLQGP